MVINRFSVAFRGYDKNEVEAFITENQHKYDETLSQQKERIFDLVDQLEKANEELDRYRLEEKAISKSLIDSQKLALEMRDEAKNYSQLVLARAKLFYATWSSYAKTLMNGLNDQEVRQFNSLSEKISQLIATFEGQEGANEVAATCSNDMVNPIDKVQQACNATIDPSELLNPTESLEDICKQLGL